MNIDQLGIVFAVLYIEEARLDEETAQVFKLADPVELYQSRMQQLGVTLDTIEGPLYTAEAETPCPVP